MDEDVKLPELPAEGGAKKKSSKSSAKPRAAAKAKLTSGTDSGSIEKSSVEPVISTSESSDSSANPTSPGIESPSTPPTGADAGAVEERVDILAELKAMQSKLHAFMRQAGPMPLMAAALALFGKSLVALHNALVKSGHAGVKKEPSDDA